MDRLNKLIEKKRVSNYKLAKDLNIHEGTIRQWRKGKTEPRSGNLLKLSNYFQVSASWLQTGEETQAPTLRDDLLYLFEKADTYVNEHPESYPFIKNVIMGIISEPDGYKKDSPVQKKREGTYEIPTRKRKAQ